MPIPYFTEALLLAIIGLLIWLITRVNRSRTDAGTTRIEVRLEEQLKRMNAIDERIEKLKFEQQEAASKLREKLVNIFSDLRDELRKILAEHNKGNLESLQSGMTNTQKQVGEYLSRYSEEQARRMEGLTKKTDQRLQEISGQVEKRLSEGFEKTTATFQDIIKRLALIDEAQKKITELSSNVVSLQEVLADKRSRGAFGEVQLNALVANVLPESSYTLQYNLPNNTRADCAIFLPDPIGTIIIDAKFTLESYQKLTDLAISDIERKQAERQFKQDISKHIKDIADKYIIPGTTSDGAIMFIPAEAIFAEIQAHHIDIVEKARTAKIWMASPTTLHAILTTIQAVLKDAATRDQIHIIQKHLRLLSEDFGRFQKRMDNLSRHIKQAKDDVDEVNTSARKISTRFEKIEQAELGHDEVPELKAIEDEKKGL